MRKCQWFTFAVILFLGGGFIVNFPSYNSLISPDAAFIRLSVAAAVGQALLVLGVACGICGFLEPRQKH